METPESQEVKSEEKEDKTQGVDTNRMATRSTSSYSQSNSPRSSDQKGFKSNIPFPTLRSPLNRRSYNKSTVQFRTNESVEEVKEERQEDHLEPKLRHFKLINDKREFSTHLSPWSHHMRLPRGRSVGALNRVDEEKQEVQIRVKNKYHTKVTSLIDKDEFNTGVRTNLNQKSDEGFGSRVLPQEINSIAEIEQSKQGLATSMNSRVSLKQLVDEADPPERPREQSLQQPIQSIQQERNDDQGVQQPLLRVSKQKLQGQQDIMKKILKSENIESNTENEPLSSRVAESILEENQNQNEPDN